MLADYFAILGNPDALRILMATFLHTVLVSAVLVVALPAQAPLAAKAFFPNDYRHIAFVDLAAMRTRGIWEELEGSVLKLMFSQIEKEAGFALRALDRVTMVGDLREGASDDRREGTQVRVLEGNAPLGVPESVQQLWSKETLGTYEVRRRSRGSSDELFVSPRPEVQVYGSMRLVEPPLLGKPSAGTPCPDVMSLLSGRNDQLAYGVFDVSGELLQKNVLAKLFPDTTWPAGEAPSFMCLRLLATGDADDPHLSVEAVLRHGKEGPGMDASSKAFDELLARLVAMPQLRSLKPVWKRVEAKRHGADLIYVTDLGRVRDAVGHVAMLGGLLFGTAVEATPTAAPAPAAPVAPAPPVAPKK